VVDFSAIKLIINFVDQFRVNILTTDASD